LSSITVNYAKFLITNFLVDLIFFKNATAPPILIVSKNTINKKADKVYPLFEKHIMCEFALLTLKALPIR